MRKNIGFCILLLSTVVLVSSCAQTISQQNDLDLLTSIENAFVNVVTRSKPAIVGIFVSGIEESQSQDRRVGSGFIFRKEGYILTNHHVVRDARYITVTLLDGSRFEAELVGTDQNTDVAVLKIERNAAFPVIPLADSSRVRVGQFAIAIGNPFGLDYTVTTGVVSGKSRSILRGFSFIRYQDFIQTDAWINTGSSGGPLLNIRGEVIGINALIRRIDEKENTPAPAMAGAGFAIPINLVKSIGDQLIVNGRVIRGYLGIQMREVKGGIRVRPIGRDTPAYLGGLRRNDIVFEYNGKKVIKPVEFQMLVAESQVGERSVIKVLRQGHERILNVTIGEMPPEYSGQPVEIESVTWEILGLSVRKLQAGDF